MKRSIVIFCLLIAVKINLIAQVNIYQDSELVMENVSLYEALSFINEGAVVGDIDLEITDNCNETQTCVLNASGTNGGQCYYTSVTIYPSVSGKTISCNLAGP